MFNIVLLKIAINYGKFKQTKNTDLVVFLSMPIDTQGMYIDKWTAYEPRRQVDNLYTEILSFGLCDSNCINLFFSSKNDWKKNYSSCYI